MILHFTKMHGCGNDYVYINGFEEKVPQGEKEALAITLSDRHFGIGSDGIIFINPSDIADFEMEMYNADGSRAEMCGNGIRCVAKYVYDHKMTDKESFTIESFKKIKYIDVTAEGGLAKMIRVDMGEPILNAIDIPVISENTPVISEPITAGPYSAKMTCVSMGNPHAVIFMDSFEGSAIDIETMDIEHMGPLFENHEKFPKRVNTEFVKLLDRSNVRMRVWERGTGETLACGTGCCATAVACVLNNLTENEVTIHVTGGDIVVKWDRDNNHIYMTGPAETVFEGTVNI